MKYLSILIGLIISVVLGANAQKKVAVYVTGDQEEGVKKVLGAKMVTYITESDAFSAVERTTDFLKALTAEHDYQTSGDVSNSQIVKLGQQFGARYVAVVDVTELYGELFVSSRLIDVETSQINSSYEATGESGSLSALANLANNVADGLILAPERKKEAQIQLAQRKRVEEMRLAQAQEKARQDQIQAELRQRAIANLTPNDAITCGNYIVINRKFPIKVVYDASAQELSWTVDGQLPSGFRIADSGVLEFLNKEYGKGSHGPLFNLFNDTQIIASNSYVKTYYNNRGKKKEVRKFKITYYVYYYDLPPGTYYLSLGTLTKTKDGWDVWRNSNLNAYALAYRPALTENEIQAEIRRLQR